MKLNHLGFVFMDVRAAAAFLEKYFGTTNLGGNKGMMHLMDEDQFILSLMKGRTEQDLHIGFGQDTEERVNEINRQLRRDGYDVPLPERSHAWTFYVQAPGGFAIEVFC